MRPELFGIRAISIRTGAIAAVASAVALAAPGAVFAGNQHGPKIDDRVAAAAGMTSSSTAIPVIVFGNSAAKQDPSLHDELDLGFATAGAVTAGQLDAIAADPNVAFVAPDVAIAPLGTPGKGAAPAGLQALYPLVDDAPVAWSAGFSGNGIGIAIVDSGVDNGSLRSRLVVKTGARNGQDQYGHGTLVAHFAAGNVNGHYVGIAPQANVIDVAVGRGRSGGVYTSDVVAGLLWVLANKNQFNIRVVNLSLTETTPSSYTSSLLDSVVELLWRSGIVVVTAAGNTGPGTEEFAPANDPFAITVGATDSQGTADPSDDTVTPWSSSGPTLDGIVKPDLVAPGRLVPGYLPHGTVLAHQAPRQNWVADEIVAISGTSFSAPQTAGAAADVLQAHPNWTPDQVKAALTGSGRPQAGSTAPALDVGAAVLTQDSPAPANQGISYSDFGLAQWIDALPSSQQPTGQAGRNQIMDHASWNAASWNAQDWLQAGWTANAWTQAGWNHASWNDFAWS
jgi:serine protease AprX